MSFNTTFTKRNFFMQPLYFLHTMNSMHTMQPVQPVQLVQLVQPVQPTQQMNSMQSVPLSIISKVSGVYRYLDENDYTHKQGTKIIDIYSEEKNIGLVQYNNKTGEIGMLIIHETFRNMGLGKFILKNIIEEMKQNQNKEVWAISNKKHDFWSNVNNKSFTYKFPVHSTTIHGGFYMKL